jgi:hypothetical protein
MQTDLPLSWDGKGGTGRHCLQTEQRKVPGSIPGDLGICHPLTQPAISPLTPPGLSSRSIPRCTLTWVSAGMAPLSLPKSGPTASYSGGRAGTCRIQRPTGPTSCRRRVINTSLGEEIRVESVCALAFCSRLDYLGFLRQRAASVLRSASNCRERLGSRAQQDGRSSVDLAGQGRKQMSQRGMAETVDQSRSSILGVAR